MISIVEMLWKMVEMLWKTLKHFQKVLHVYHRKTPAKLQHVHGRERAQKAYSCPVSTGIRIHLLAFGSLREALPERDITLEEGSTVATLLSSLSIDSKALSGAAVAVNRSYSLPSTALSDGDEVAILPPVSGGTDPVYLTRDPINSLRPQEIMKDGSDGAVVVFDGIVRNNTRGRQTLFLDYEAYEEMALKQMHELRAEGLQRYKVREISIIHRLGKLEIGETSILIVVASAHRGAAFDACRWVID
ncbi:MAG: molybdenum cofactor biosynthesis protein MoaE, partial [Bryocella sp.]